MVFSVGWVVWGRKTGLGEVVARSKETVVVTLGEAF